MLVSSNYQRSNCELLGEGDVSDLLGMAPSEGRMSICRKFILGVIRITHAPYIHCRRGYKVHRNAVMRCRFLFNSRDLSLLYAGGGTLPPGIAEDVI